MKATISATKFPQPNKATINAGKKLIYNFGKTNISFGKNKYLIFGKQTHEITDKNIKKQELAIRQ
ncbi:MAG: hypothetical protein SPF56_10705 [Bacteroidaceae bacterium]|nr:hypothetical protein [Bacteroidaceae bacterium]